MCALDGDNRRTGCLHFLDEFYLPCDTWGACHQQDRASVRVLIVNNLWITSRYRSIHVREQRVVIRNTLTSDFEG